MKEKRAYIVHRAILDIEGHITEKSEKPEGIEWNKIGKKISVGYEAEDVSYFINKWNYLGMVSNAMTIIIWQEE